MRCLERSQRTARIGGMSATPILAVVPTSPVRLAVPAVEDFGYIARRMRPDEQDQFVAITGVREYDADVCARSALATRGQSFVLVGTDNRAIMVGGFDELRPGVVEGWALGTLQGWADHWRPITRLCRRLIEERFTGDVHRVQVVALASRTQAHEWYERGLGMRREGVLRGYAANGADAIIFARNRA